MKASIYHNDLLAGELEKTQDGIYRFQYTVDYLYDPNQPAISLTLPKRKSPYISRQLFPFFFNLLSEGVNKKLQCRLLKIDENDYFNLLLATCQTDVIGAVRAVPALET